MISPASLCVCSKHSFSLFLCRLSRFLNLQSRFAHTLPAPIYRGWRSSQRSPSICRKVARRDDLVMVNALQSAAIRHASSTHSSAKWSNGGLREGRRDVATHQCALLGRKQSGPAMASRKSGPGTPCGLCVFIRGQLSRRPIRLARRARTPAVIGCAHGRPFWRGVDDRLA